MDLDAIKARAEAATEGPWAPEFIAHARADVPALLSALTDAYARIKELEAGR